MFLDKAFLANQTTLNVTISYMDTFADQKVNFTLQIDPKTMIQDDAIIKMAVKRKIDLTLFNHRAEKVRKNEINKPDDPQISKYLIALSEKYQVLCEKTAYILVL